MVAERVLIADDHPLIVEALSLAVGAALPGAPVDRAGTVADAVALAETRGGYRLVLLDFMLPDARGFSGLLRVRQAIGEGVPILLITAHRGTELIDAARALGAAGFLSKAMPLDAMAQAIRGVLAGDTAFPSGETRDTGARSARERLDTLSGAQLRVLLALADGKLNKQVAGDLGVTEATVKAHLTAVFRKLGVTNRTQALLALQPVLGEGLAEEAR